MLIELTIALILGVLIGSITGILPGIHINLVSVFLVSLASISLINPVFLAVFIVAMAITHTFVDFIPSIFLGAPDTDTSLSILPGHQYLLEGKGYSALIMTLYGSVLAIPLILIFTPLFILLLPKVFYYLKFVMFFVLVSASVYLIASEKNSKLTAILIFLLSGFLGLVVLNLNLKESLLPMLSGLFGSSSLITSIIKKQKIPKQEISKFKEIKISKKELGNVTLASLLITPLCSFLPALGSSQAAVMGSELIERKSQKEFLILLGAINTIIMGLSFVTLFAIQKSRTGAAVAVSKLISELNFSNLSIILATILLSAILASLLTVYFAKIFAKNISKINYSKLSVFILIFLSIVVLIFSGLIGFSVFLVSTLVGLTAILSETRRTHLMGSMIITSILFYLPI